MKTTRYITDDELIEQAVKALMKTVGPVNTSRFLNLRRTRRIESVSRHRRWQATLDKKKFFDKVFSN